MSREPVWPLVAMLTVQALCAQTVPVPNPSFEDGGTVPQGWTLAGGQGEWLAAGAAVGTRAVAVTGSGTDTNAWRSQVLQFRPSTAYRVSFMAKQIGASGGTPVTGPVFCNRDLGKVPDSWTAYSSVFVTPREITPDNGWLRFGQWHVNGTVAFDDVDLVEAQPVYATHDGLVLGEGESVRGNTYEFRAPFHSASRNHSRPLDSYQCGFNTYRWVFGRGSDVVYRFHLDQRLQTSAEVDVSVTWYAGGELLAEASRDGRSWEPIGTQGELGTLHASVPGRLLTPAADEVWVRLRAQAKRETGADSDPGSFQVAGFSYHAAFDGPVADLQGRTQYVRVTQNDPRLSVAVARLGTGLPGADNTVTLHVTNRTDDMIPARPAVMLRQGESSEEHAGAPVRLGPGETTLTCDYTIPGTGDWKVGISLGPGVRYACDADLYVPDFYDTSYGEALPGSTEGVGLWWAESGWKIPVSRPTPTATGQAVRIRAARGEVDAAQLVVRPSGQLRGLNIAAGDLRGPQSAVIPAASVEVLRVGYVDVSRPTDATGVAALWPDPLPPLAGPLQLESGRNHPLWVRLTVPRNARAGSYRGELRLSAEGYEARAPLHLTVYDFELPGRMSCTTAFGFSPGSVWHYHNLRTEEQRREVLAKYWENFSSHHISPYDPAPMDPFRVRWPSAVQWHGGTRDQTKPFAGKSCLLLRDETENANLSSRFAKGIKIPADGLRFRFRYRTAAPGHTFIVTLNHSDGNGQWMSGRNNDMRVQGNGEWQPFDRTVTAFPEGAESVNLTLWATLYAEDGSYTGTVWFDDVSLQDVTTGDECLADTGFEPVDASVLKPVIEWTAWDKAMTRAIGHYHFNAFRLPVQGLGGGTFHARTEPSLLGFAESTAEYQAAFSVYCRELAGHLKRNGWLDEAFVYWFDEPDPKDYEFVMNGFRKLKREAPGLRRMLTEQVEEALVGGPNVWCPVSPNYDHEKAEVRRAAGERFWWYVCTGPKAPYCTLFIDHPATELRVWLWQTWQRKIEGILVWQTNYWTSAAAYPERDRPQNPYEDPMGWVSGYSTPAGTKRPWGNGDGRFIYPPPAAADARQQEAVLDGPVDSIRWEMLRDGIEDYEYLAILKRLVDRNSGRLSTGDRTSYEALLNVPAEITSGMTTFTKDPAPIEARRDAVARAIERLSKL